MGQTRTLAAFGIVSALGLLGCQGGGRPQADMEEDEVVGGASGSGNGPTADPTLPVSCSDTLQPGPSPLRRLTRFEYNNTVLELLGDASQPANVLPPEELGNGFGNDATALAASQLLVEGYQQVARALADAATSSERFVEVVGCDLEATEEATECAHAFIASFGARAYRRPLSEDELGRMQALFDASFAELSFAEAVADVIAAMLQAPQFLYRVELDRATLKDSQVAPLSSYELATRLSYLLWGSMPDQALFEQADSDGLRTAEQVRETATRMLEDPRARQVVRYFHTNLFGLTGLDYLSKDAAAFPTFSNDLGSLFRRESEMFLDHVVWEGDGTLKTMLAGNFTFMNGPLAEFYGVKGPQGELFELVELEPTRAGLLTQAGLMASLTPGASTNPVVRGAFVRTRLLCTPLPDPPADLMVEEPAIDAELTTRERFERHRTDSACSGCHRLMDPIGLAFENFDGLGQWRDEENGKPIDAAGELLETDVDGPVSGAVELVQKLASSEEVSSCYANQWMSFGYGRGFAAEDACTRARVEAAFAGTGDVRELMIALTQTDAFMYRSEEQP